MSKKPLTPDSSLRNVFLRVTAINEIKEASGAVTDTIIYTFDDFKNMVDAFIDRYPNTQYFYIQHDKDVDADGYAKKPHFHLYMKFGVKNIVKWKYVKEVFPYGDIEGGRNNNACVQYLIHKNHPDKHQYDRSEIVTNVSDEQMDKYFINDGKLSMLKEIDELEEYLQDIAAGAIRRFNLFEYINVELYSKYRQRIENAFKYRELQVGIDKNRQIDVWFITGESGCEKTTIAKKYAEKSGVGVCISSCANDLLQDYAGEDTLILDDLRDADFKYNELLKVLDNHTKSSVRSRYNNKLFSGKLIIITSYRELDDWYSSVPEEAKMQLYRRISTLIKVTKDELEFYKLHPSGFCELSVEMKNPVPELHASKESERDKNIQNVAAAMLDAFEFSDDLKGKYSETIKIAETAEDEDLPF